MNTQTAKVEWLKCYQRPDYFIRQYIQIYDSVSRSWIPFDLWPDQKDALDLLSYSKLVVWLKARQIGGTWVSLSVVLWLTLFYPIQTALLFSKRDAEAMELLGFRFRGMYQRLPRFLQSRGLVKDSSHEIQMSNGSRVLAFPTTGGRSYTSTISVIDEADYVDLDVMLDAIKPGIEAGGKLIVLGTADKSNPGSSFKRIFREAQAGRNGYTPIFLPWQAAPWRTQEWYDREMASSIAVYGTPDHMHQEYPATPEEALSPNSLDKRIPRAWLLKGFREREPIEPPFYLPGLVVYENYILGERYTLGVDTAEGNPTSDDSAIVVLKGNGEEVARLRGKVEPTVLATYVDKLASYYIDAGVMVERNNHGHTTIAWLRDNSVATLLPGHDKKLGWMSSTKGKAIMYDELATAFRDGGVLIHSEDVFDQIASIEGSTLRAPEGFNDDLADATALAVAGGERYVTLEVGVNPLLGYRG